MDNELPGNGGADPMVEILEWFHSIPLITRTWFGASVVITAAETLEVLPGSQLVFDTDRLFAPHLELWRILTSFVWAGPGTLMDFHVLILLYSIATIVGDFEKAPLNTSRRPNARSHHGRRSKYPRSDFAFALLTCAVFIIGSYHLLMKNDLILHAYGLPFLCDLDPVFTRTLVFAVVTLHSCRHPNANININFFPVPGRYVPFFHLAFGLLMGGRIHEIVHGIVVGYVYYALVITGILSTPDMLIYWVEGEAAVADERIIGDVGVIDEPLPAPSLEPGANLLHRAAAIGDVALLEREAASSVTDDDLARFRQADRNGWQPLHEAARAGQEKVICFLASPQNVARFGIDVNARTSEGRGGTALYLAEMEGWIDHPPFHPAVEALREAGALRIDPGTPIREEEENDDIIEEDEDNED